MFSKSKGSFARVGPTSKSALKTIQTHQIEAARAPGVPIRTLAGAEFAGRPIKAWSRDPAAAKRLNDALRPGRTR